MKYILLLILALPIFAQNTKESKSVDKIDDPSKTTDLDNKTSSEQQSKDIADNKNLTQAEIRKKKKWEIGLGYGEGNSNFSLSPGVMNLNLQYNWTSRFSVGYTHLHKRSFSTKPEIVGALVFDLLTLSEETNLKEVGLLNFRFYFFEKFPLYFTGGIGRDWIGSYKRTEYQYGYINRDRNFQADPIVRESSSLPSNYRFLGLGFQWVFQNGFFIAIERTILQNRYDIHRHSLIVSPNYSLEAIVFEKLIFSSNYSERITTDFTNLKLGYSIGF